ncbi:SLAIN motif-containing protein 1-like isoform X3 [Siniperca chuatsi]|uniref:SLAIN motif-containing protein 1-like isoform X3 n=1 Tax=Siniperca chuatsi TaxID=119488 RepID=UPI001CE07AF2|nr:SLAIN motif-containing protein 1-like isoform X3 [Siniperca chuatsi]
MEAAVLNLAMMTEVDCNSNTLNAELEVKKLQELVRKLERQNEQLRTRASGCSGGPHVLPSSPAYMLGNVGGYCLPSPLPTLLCQSSLGSFTPPEDPFDYFLPHIGGDGAAAAGEAEDGSEPSVLDELELLDLNSLSCSDESDETWLYSSSKTRVSPDNSLTPLQWCRQALDCPKTEVEAARRSLSLRLEQVSRWRSSLSSPVPSSSAGPPLSRVAGVSPISASPSAKPLSTPQSSERHAPSLPSPFHPALHRTLSPVGKELSPVAERTPTFFPHNRSRSLRSSALSPQSSMDSDLGASEVEDDSITLGYKLQDLTDVQVMARLQEENLRAHRYFSFINPRRSKTGLRQHVVRPGQPPQPELHLPAQPAQRRPRPGGGRRGGRRRLRPPAPTTATPHPPAALPHLLQHPRLAKKHKFPLHPSFHPLHASVPFRWVRLSTSAPGTGTGTGQPLRSRAAGLQTRISQSFDSSSGLARLQSSIPSPGQLQNRVQSVGNFASLSRQPLKATAYVSPTIKGSASMPTSSSLQSLNSSSSGGNSGVGSGIPLLSKPASGGGTLTSTPNTPRSSLPRPASFVGTTSSTPRSKVAQPARSLLTPPKSLSTLSALRDSSWRDGCY